MRDSGFCPSRLSSIFVVLAILMLCMSEQMLAQSKYTFPMPEVIGLTIPEAEKRVYATGRSIGVRSAKAQTVERRPNERPAGQIIQQLEEPGTPMRRETDDVGGNYGEVIFRVVVSTGPPRPTTFPMPDVIGLTIPEAEERVYSAGQAIRVTGANAQIVERRPNERPAGQIIQQLEEPGTPMRRETDDVGGNYGEVIFRVVVSTGLPLPSYLEQSADVARRDSQQLGFELEEQTEDNVDIARGVIFKQDPEPGTILPLEGPLRVTVSNGWPTPDFLTLGENEAMSLATEKQVSLEIAERRRNREVQPDIVIEQFPLPDTLLAPDQAVRVVMSAIDPTPPLIGLMEDEALSIASNRDINLEITRELNREFVVGMVTDQSPRPNAPLPGNGRVSVVISSDRPTPDFVGKAEEEAISIAGGWDITLVKIAPGEHYEISAGRVTGQSPVAGTVIPEDRRVNISLSLGWPVAPDAVGSPFASVKREFLARHPNAILERNENLLTIEPAGTVVSQHPQPGVKLGTKQRLRLVVSATKPPWLWPVGGVVLVTLLLGGIAGLNSVLSRTTRKSVSTENPGGVRLRVTKDHGVQSTETKDDEHDDHTRNEDIVKIRVKVDLGEQTAYPKDDKGDGT